MDDDEENFNEFLEQNKKDMMAYISNNNFDIMQLKNNVLYKSNISSDKEININLKNNDYDEYDNKQIFQQLKTPILSKCSSQNSINFNTIPSNNIKNNFNILNKKNTSNDSFSSINDIEKKRKYLKLFYGDNENNLNNDEKKKYNFIMKKLDKEEEYEIEKEKQFDKFYCNDSFDGKIQNIVTRYLGQSNNNKRINDNINTENNLNNSKNETLKKSIKKKSINKNKKVKNKLNNKNVIINNDDKKIINSYKRELIYLKGEYEKLLKENKNLKEEIKKERFKNTNYKEIAENIISIYEKSIKK
jgi:hypothetical protein